VRALQFVLIALLIVMIIVPFLVRRRRPVASRPRPVLRDELVKDPVCQTYVVRSRAVAGADAKYFCSAECARRWAAQSRG
jgi:hypothetical protein